MKAPRIIATIGHGSHHDQRVCEIVDAGANVLRYNAATMKTMGETVERIARARRALLARSASSPPRSSASGGTIPVMVDLPFPRKKQRLHTLRGAEYDVPKGQTFRFVCRPELQTEAGHILVEMPAFAGIVEPGEVFIIGDGELAFRVTAVLDAHRFEAVALTKWYFSNGKSIHLARVPTEPVDAAPYITELAAAFGPVRPEYLAFSFVETARDMEQIRALLAPHVSSGAHAERDAASGWTPKLVAKIETEDAVRNIDAILDASDLVLYARGDMAIQAPYEMLGVHQKRVVARARARGVPVIIATQVLETTMTRYVPNRSEVLDLTNLIIDGAWGVMLAKETSAPDNPVYPVTVAKRIIDAVVASAIGGEAP